MAGPFQSASWFKVASLRPRLRDHARVRRLRYRGAIWYVIDNGATGRAHRFSLGAYLLIGRFDGTRTVDSLWQHLVEELEEDAPTQDEVIHVLSQLHNGDLLASDLPPDTDELTTRRRKEKRKVWMQNLKSPLSLRIPLIDPENFLNRTMSYVRPLFGWFGLALWLALVIPALLLAGRHWEALTNNIYDRVLSVDNLLLMSLVYPVVKALHELGHGYAAKKNGCEVREMGIMLLLFFPVPYVDASAASALRDKYQRAFVGAAGMIVELALAAIALFAWVLLEPGLARAIAYNVMLIAGISTVLVNGNPLLRFDGYYILADLIEVPNLGSRANQYWGHLIDRHVFRTHDDTPFAATPGEKRWFVVYAPLAFVARMLMLFGIALIVAKRFFLFGVLLALWSIWTGVGQPLWKMGAHVVSSPKLQRNRRRALQWSGGTVAAVLLILFVIPLPHHVNTEGVIWLPDEGQVRARNDGRISRITTEEGTRVAAGHLLGEAQRPAIDANVAQLAWRVRELEAKAAADLTTDRVKLQISRLELDEARQKLAVERSRQSDLNLVARMPGTFLLAGTPAGDLPGRYVKKGDMVGYVVPDRADRARIAVHQDDIALVRQHLRGISFKVADRSEKTWDARLLREVPGAGVELPSAALASANGGPFAVDPSDPHQRNALTPFFQFDIGLPPELRKVPFGTRVFVRFRLDPEPVGWQIGRRVRQLFLAQFNA